MAYGRKFIMRFTAKTGDYYEVYFDYNNYVGTATQITAGKNGVQFRSTAGDENRLQPILGIECLIDIFVSQKAEISIDDLVADSDDQIMVTVARIDENGNSLTHFIGFVVVEDNSRPFHDPPYVLTVRALDGLGMLKGVDLQDTNGLLFTGSLTVIEWVAQILYKTSNLSPIRSYFNFFPANYVEFDALSEIMLNANTFSQGDAFNTTPNDPSVDENALSADDCYTALEKIMRCFRCRIFFEAGRWHIVNLYEYMSPTGYHFIEYAFQTPVNGFVPLAVTGSSQNLTVPPNYSINISKNEFMHPQNADQNLFLKLAYRFIKLTYLYNQSLNKVCNQDLKDTSTATRNAAYDEVISSSVIDSTIQPVVNLQTIGHNLFCWDDLNSTAPSHSSYPQYFLPYPNPGAPTKNAFIRIVQDQIQKEMTRFLVIPDPNLGTPTSHFVRAKRFLADTNDIVQFSFDWRTRLTIPATTKVVCFLYLYADDGTFYSYRQYNASGSVNGWIQTDQNFFDNPSNPGLNAVILANPNANGLQWQNEQVNEIIPNLQAALIPVPKSGQVELIFLNFGSNTGNEVWIKNISVTITSYLQGSYTQLKGDFNYLASANKIKQSESDDVQISDSPKRYFKGALLQTDGLTLIPADWHRKGFPGEHFRFTQCMAMIIYNMQRRMVKKMEGTFKGLLYRDPNNPGTKNPAGYLNSYYFTDGNFPTKKFILTSYDRNIATGEGRHVFVEVLADANDNGWTMPDVPDFQYIYQ